ncbi:hypothetical protein Tco_0602517 [Tanacetum coccineum]
MRRERRTGEEERMEEEEGEKEGGMRRKGEGSEGVGRSCMSLDEESLRVEKGLGGREERRGKRRRRDDRLFEGIDGVRGGGVGEIAEWTRRGGGKMERERRRGKIREVEREKERGRGGGGVERDEKEGDRELKGEMRGESMYIDCMRDEEREREKGER